VAYGFPAEGTGYIDHSRGTRDDHAWWPP